MRGSGRGGEVGDPRKVSHPLCRFRVRRVRVMLKVYTKKSTPSFQPQLYQARLVKKKSHLSSFVSLLLSAYKLDIDTPNHPKKKMLEKLELQNQSGQNNPQIL